MRILIISFLCFLCACAVQSSNLTKQYTPRLNLEAEPIKYTNAYWYSIKNNEVSFEKRDMYSVNGVFTDVKPQQFKIVDLNGLYVIPPFGEAHNHSVDGPGTEKVAKKFINEGVFYFKNANSIYSYTQPLLSYWKQAGTLDLSFTHGGLSKDEGHPEKLYKTLSGYGMYANIDAENFDGNAFYDVNSLEKLNERWEQILATKPDFLKLYLLEHDSSSSDGLSEDIFREVVKRANTIGLKTTVHVETVQDLELAVNAGATEAAHLPAYNLGIAKKIENAKIPDSLIKKMAANNFIVVTTTNVSARRNYKTEDYELVANQQKDNLQRLHKAGVPIAIGSDSFYETAISEINTLKKMGAFNDQTLLRLWIETPQLSIFPNRAIGQLQAGFETSFLALSCNPFENFDCITKIEQKVKQGFLLK